MKETNEEARLKEARTRLEKLNRSRSELQGELKQIDKNLQDMGVGTNPKEIDKWLKEKASKLRSMEEKAEDLLNELEEVLDEIGNL
jgi:predicted transcriptional regulator